MTAGRWLVIGLLAVSLAVGCGGDDGGGGSSTTEWADGVCSAITTWSESITSTADSLRGGNPTEGELRNAVDDFESATSNFVDDLRGLGAPDTESGEQAKESLDELSGNVEENVSRMKSAVDDASGASEVLEAISTVSATLSTMGQQLSATFTELEQLDAGGELERAFSDADSCDELESGGS
jgi:ABC-type transporter Mla subunit MlaD